RKDVLRDQPLEKRVSEQRVEEVGDRADEDAPVGISCPQRWHGRSDETGILGRVGSTPRRAPEEVRLVPDLPEVSTPSEAAGRCRGGRGECPAAPAGPPSAPGAARGGARGGGTKEAEGAAAA